MVTKWDKIAFVLIAALLVLVIIFRSDLSGVFTRKGDSGGKDDTKGKKEKKKDADKKKGSLSPLATRPILALWPGILQPTAWLQHPAILMPHNL